MAGPGSQKNKPHKAGRRAGRSAREKHRDKKDMMHRSSIKSSNATHAKADRLNTAKQQRHRKRAELLEARRTQGPPCLVALLPLSDDVDVQALWEGLLNACRDTGATTTAAINDAGMDVEAATRNSPTALAPITMSHPDRRKVKFTFLPPPLDRSDPMTVVEMARSAEVVLCALPGDAQALPIDEQGQDALSILCAMGLPSPIAVVQTLNGGATTTNASASLKERSAAKKRAAEAFLTFVPGDHRVMAADTMTDFKQILRHLADNPQSAPLWRRQRPQLIAQNAEYFADPDNPSVGRLVLSGYVRGQALSATQALHIPTAGDFQIEQIEGPPEPTPANEPAAGIRKGSRGATAMDTEAINGIPILAQAPLEAREPLIRENEPDLLDAEQTWPTEEELKEAEVARAAQVKKRRLPKGTSDYQAAWILDDDVGDEDEEDDVYADDESLPDLEYNPIHQLDPGMGLDNENDDDTWQHMDGGATEVDMDYADEDEEEHSRELVKMKARRAAEVDELQFPDEVETPVDIPARQRFARYRGLKSFRTSPWDPKEDLPQDYARVFAFENFKRTLKRARQTATATPPPGAGVLPGTFVNVHASAVPAAVALRVVERVKASQSGAAPVLSVFGLMQHECKLSVCNFGIKKASTYTDPVANKEELLFVTGLRSFMGRPIFSTDEHGADKHKMERFLLEGRPTVATVYAPISYPSLPLLAFKQLPSGRLVLAASGSLRDCNPDRVVLKKIVLSGYPVKVHKSKAVVRWMFHTPEDVRWFRPVELWTKQGRRGRIREPVGTHGTMKCIFDGPVGQQDGVCMSLYKRAYPKWPTDMAFA